MSSDDRSLRAEYLVGCDGGRSLIRKKADIEFAGWDPTTSYLIGEVEMTQEPEWGIRRGEKGINAIAKLDDGKRARVVLNEHHSDRGSQYVCLKYTERLAAAGIEPSVGSVGDSYDNALAETINGLYKAELIHRRGPWRSLEAVEFATLEWVDWFNNRRLMGPLGNIPPAEAEQRYYAELDSPALVA